jgi:hypothetical protein
LNDMVSNPNYYSQSTTSGFNQIEDGVDFPHTGIIKSLSQGLGQNYAISGFDITFDSATQIDVGAGVILRDGKRIAISAVPNLTLGRTTASENSYHLVVVDKDNAIVIRSPSAKDKVAPYTERTGSNAHGDTIIAVVTHNGSNPMPVQYLTISKAENSASIGYSNSGTYTEAMSIEGDATRTLFKNKVADADIRFVLADNTADERFEIYSDDDSDGDEGDTALFTVNGLGATSIAGTVNLGSVANAGTDTDKFLVLDSGGNVDFRTGTEVRSDIGAGTLSAESDTLDTVTGRGNTTANDITAGSIASTVNQNISFELITAGQPISGGKTVVYAFQLSGPVALPAPATGNILYIKNIDPAGPITITGSPLIDNGVHPSHPKLTAANQITLNPFETVTLQAVNDVGGVIQAGHMIISD